VPDTAELLSVLLVARDIMAAGRSRLMATIESNGDAKTVQVNYQKAFDNAFEKLQRQLLTFLATLLGARGVVDFARNVTKAETALGIFSAAFGVPARNLDAPSPFSLRLLTRGN
jgi:hypothetical protein